MLTLGYPINDNLNHTERRAMQQMEATNKWLDLIALKQQENFTLGKLMDVVASI